MEQAQQILEGLDEQQRRAATTLNGPVRIIAGAGAGKTRTVTRRIAYACATGAWKPERALAVTFSVKAAAEMRARLEQLGLQGGTSGVTAATFHSAALRQLNSVWADVCEAPFPHLIENQRDTVSRAITRATAVRDIDALTVRDVISLNKRVQPELLRQPVELRGRSGHRDGRHHHGHRLRRAAEEHEGADEVTTTARIAGLVSIVKERA
ncbi:UvrD/REP helicase [Bifidobacterium bifidum]|nr:UvrD/REP helicase [Bifidobacterium bifidum]